MKKKNKNKKKDSIESNILPANMKNGDSNEDNPIDTAEKSEVKPTDESEVDSAELETKEDDLPTQISKLKLEMHQEVDRRLRLMAEFDNFRKRTQSDYQRIYATAGEKVIIKLLPIIDDFQRFLDQEIDDVEPKALKQGIDLIYKKLLESLASENVKPIESLGKDFNAEIHEAIAQLEDESKPSGIVLTEVERGYLMGKKVIRHSKVVVNSYSDKEVESNNE